MNALEKAYKMAFPLPPRFVVNRLMVAPIPALHPHIVNWEVIALEKLDLRQTHACWLQLVVHDQWDWQRRVVDTPDDHPLQRTALPLAEAIRPRLLPRNDLHADVVKAKEILD